jgi:hypothetical protein
MKRYDYAWTVSDATKNTLAHI